MRCDSLLSLWRYTYPLLTCFIYHYSPILIVIFGISFTASIGLLVLLDTPPRGPGCCFIIATVSRAVAAAAAAARYDVTCAVVVT